MSDTQRQWPDWRIQAATTLAADVPSAYPGGPSHKAGAPVYLVTVARDLSGLLTGFITASPAALALSAAIEAAASGEQLRLNVAYAPVSASPHGPGFDVTEETTPVLYDFFEAGFIAVTLSYQALEAFANSVIADRVSGRIEIKRGNRTLFVDADDAQRKATLDEKLTSLLPRVTKLQAPDRALLKRVSDLVRIRHETVHLKGRDAYPRGEEPLTGYFHRLLGVDLRSFPRTAVAVMLHFSPDDRRPNWLREAAERAER